MNDTIRPFATTDYPALSALGAAVYPGLPMSAEELQEYDEKRAAGRLLKRWMAVVNDAVVGMAEFEQHDPTHQPQRFSLDTWVHPAFRGQGIGSALYALLLAELDSLRPTALHCNTREDQPEGIRFIEARGFHEVMRSSESRLELAAFEPAAHPDAQRVTEQEGIRIQSFRDLLADPERNRKLFDLVSEVWQDVPSPEPVVPLTYEQYVERSLENPQMLHDQSVVAVHGSDYVGLSTMRRSSEEGLVSTGLTGVRRAWRGRRIALALKVAALDRARAAGYQTVRTFNETNNQPILKLNQHLGFLPRPGFIEYLREMEYK